LPRRDDIWLKSFISRICEQIEEYRGRSPNYIEVQALIRRFVENNPDADPEEIDWVAYYDPRLKYSEILQRFKEAYPGYRWEAEEVKEKEYDEERYFHELYNYLREQAKELPEDLRKRLLMELSAEFGFEVEKPAEEVVVTPEIERAVINIEFMARYPFIEEAREFLKRMADRMLNDEIINVAANAILDAIRLGEVKRRCENSLYELLSKPVANAMVVYYDINWLKRRYALAEAIRVERLLSVDSDVAFKLLLKRIPYQITETDEWERGDGEYKMPFIQYLQAAKPLLTEPRWKLVNRIVKRGYTYLNKAEVVRLIRGYYQQFILKILVELRPSKVPPRIRDVAERYRPLILGALQKIYDIRKSVESSKEIPPCIKNIIMKLQTGEEVTHIENFTVAAYLLNKHRSVEEVLELFKNRNDFNERVARYQVEHIAGLRGSKTKYRPPSCEKLKILGICVDGGRHCPRWIKNPLQYLPLTRQKKGESDNIE